MIECQTPRLRQLCSTLARERKLDPIGAAYPYDHFLIMEGALPWPKNKFQQPGVLPADVIDLHKNVIFRNYPDDWIKARLCIIAPDRAYSQPGLRRVIYARRPTPPFAIFDQQEYLVPEEELGPLTWALFARPEELPDFERYRQSTDGVRDFLVCTDGVVDRACAVAGMKLYSTLRKLPEAQPGGPARIWKTSHFGGHVYAATVITLPDGRLWGFLDGETGPALVRRQGDIGALRTCYRGWTGSPSPFVDVVERELMMRYGWDWFDFAQVGVVVAEDQEGPLDDHGERQLRWAEVELRYRSPDGATHGLCARRVEVSHTVETFYASDNPATYAYQQYRLATCHSAQMPQA
jgi:hypothetical protein